MKDETLQDITRTDNPGRPEKEKLPDGVYAECSVCGNPIYEQMEKNKEYFDGFKMCGACTTGESAEYIDEL